MSSALHQKFHRTAYPREMMAQMIEKRTDLSVDRKFNLGGTIICHQALKRGEIDLYAEYTGTGLMAILQLPAMNNPDEVYDRVSGEYLTRFSLVWLEPFGFNNTYTLTVRKQTPCKINGKSFQI